MLGAYTEVFASSDFATAERVELAIRDLCDDQADLVSFGSKHAVVVAPQYRQVALAAISEEG